ncbi:MAG TPA: DUF4173 domain-containing protein [Candidatus Limnocylindrales bacterium]
MPFPTPAARRILLLALGMGVLVDVLFPGNAAGVNVAMVVAALFGAGSVVAGRDGLRRVDPVDAWIPVAAVAFAAMPSIRADDWLVAVDLAFATILGAGTIGCLAGARITRGLVPAVVGTAVAVVAAAVTGAVTVLGALRARRPTGAAEGAVTVDVESGTTGRRVPSWVVGLLPVARGLLIAVPVLTLFALLFASADAVFAELARTALGWRVDLDLSSVVDRAMWVSVVAWGAAGLLALAAGLLPSLIPGRGPSPLATSAGGRRPHAGRTDGPPPPPWWTNRSLGAASVTELRQPVRLGSVEAATVITLVVALFAGFVALQLTYLFGGRDTMTVAGLGYAEYARRGFFELVAVAVLAGTLVVALDVVVAVRGRAQLVASLALLGLTGVVLLSAFVRLRLYQDMYGWTELRFVVVVAIGWLAVALVVTAWLLSARMTRWTLHGLGIMVLVTVAAVNVVGPQAFVTDRNLERALNPSIVPAGGRTGLDADYLSTLGDEAVPAVVAAYPSLPTDARRALEAFLVARRTALAAESGLHGWPAWNLTRERARAALAGWEPDRR